MKQLFVSKREPAFSRELYLDERWVLAFDRASAKRRQAIFVNHAHFQVHSSRSTKYNPIKYSITHTGRGITGWECTCPSGFPTTACWHRATVLRRLQREPHLTNPPPKPLAPRTITPAIRKSLELREQARDAVEHSKRLQAQMRERREMAGMPAMRLEDFYE